MGAMARECTQSCQIWALARTRYWSSLAIDYDMRRALCLIYKEARCPKARQMIDGNKVLGNDQTRSQCRSFAVAAASASVSECPPSVMKETGCKLSYVSLSILPMWYKEKTRSARPIVVNRTCRCNML